MYPPSADPAERARPVDRMFLREVLLSGLDDVVEFGREFDRYELRPGGGVTAHFSDGTSADGDILVGADGSGSAVRRQYLPDADPVPSGALGIPWTIPLDGPAGPEIPERLRHGMNLIMTAAPLFLFTSVFRRPPQPGNGADAAQGDYLLCALVARREACAPGIGSFDGPQLQSAVTALMSGWHPSLVGLASRADTATFGTYSFAAAPAVTWSSSAVTVLGDAIHSMPPVGGIGANMALRDASLLTRNLAAATRGEMPPLAAISDYEAEMRDYGFGAVHSALANQRLGIIANPAAQVGMRTWFRLCARVPALRRAGFRDRWDKDARPRAWETSAIREATVS